MMSDDGRPIDGELSLEEQKRFALWFIRGFYERLGDLIEEVEGAEVEQSVAVPMVSLHALCELMCHDWLHDVAGTLFGERKSRYDYFVDMAIEQMADEPMDVTVALMDGKGNLLDYLGNVAEADQVAAALRDYIQSNEESGR
jgi:hypothetical protein